MVSIMRITRVEILKKWKCAKQTAISKSFKRLESDVHIVGKVGNHDLNIGNVQNKQQFRKVWNHCKSYIHCARYVGIDDLNYICHG